METAHESTIKDQRERLNKIYRLQRHFYDLTRRFFLFGRDRLLRQMDVQTGSRVLEIGCGTGRNLIRLAQIGPGARLFGLDASDEMLNTAAAKLDARDLQKEICLRRALAEDFDFRETFGLEEPFDKIFISYALSMFPAWQDALRNALGNLKAGGDLYIIDFWDGAGLPRLLISLRNWWLGLFKIYYRPEYLEFLKRLQAEGKGKFTLRSVGTNYAFIVHFHKS